MYSESVSINLRLLFTPTPVIGFLESVGKCAEIEKIFIHSK